MSKLFFQSNHSHRGPFGRRAGGLAGTALGAALLAGAAQADPEYDAQWGLGMVGAKAAHDRGYTGAGVTVGLVDSGIFQYHPDLAGRLSPISRNGSDGAANDGIDAQGQGTHLAGIIAANRNGTGMVGVAYGAQVSALQLTTRGSASIDMSRIDFIAAGLFDHGHLNGIEFYNNAWGSAQIMPSSGAAMDTVRDFFETDRKHTLDAIRRGVDAGSIYVWSAGDSGDTSVKLEAGLPHLYPELKGHWMAVAAVGQTGEIASYSNRCGLAATWCISAPGGDDDASSGGINSTSNSTGYQRLSGTAQASAHVSGALAIAREMFPNAKASELAQLVFATATDVGDAGIDDVYGWGILNLDALTSTRDAKTGAIFSQGAYAQGRTMGQIADIAGVLGSGGTDNDDGTVTFSTYGDAPKTDFNARWWTAPIAGLTQTSASATTASALTRTGGALIGMDFRPSQDVRFGFGLGFSETRTSSAGNRTSATGLHALAYGGLDMDRWFVDGAAGLSHFDSSTTRSGIVGAGGGAGALAGTSKGTDIGVWSNARVGMTFQTAMAALQPYAQARIVHQWLGATGETGAGAFALSAPSATSSQTDLGVGIKLSGTDFDTSAGAFRPVLDLGYARAVGSLGDSRATTMLGAPVAASSVGIGRDIARLSAGLAYASASGRVTGTLGYSGEYRARAASHALNASVSVKF
ncbi:S8 family peptidase [Stappia stellulata]|uniref:S8 family peptidase n=1 Tax=Stappia stellulata TaxID=71235 RepID=UPI00040DA65E|nr:S8 family serine peptidase [Stappia stellulata]